MRAEKYADSTHITATMPSVDEEYYEWIDLVNAVVDASDALNVVELGARYGTWAVRAYQLNRRMMNLPAHITMIEPTPFKVEWIRQHVVNNAIPENDFTIIPKGFYDGDLQLFLQSQEHVDLLDIDVQGAELTMVENAIEEMGRKV
jgi:hypothetical protein